MRLRQHGTLFIFFTKHWLEEPMFCEKSMVSSARPEPALSIVECGDIPRQNPGSPAACQHGPFRGFRSFRVFRGPNAHRVTPINDRTYAVSVQTGRFTH
jgi:hypothetical protein